MMLGQIETKTNPGKTDLRVTAGVIRRDTGSMICSELQLWSPHARSLVQSESRKDERDEMGTSSLEQLMGLVARESIDGVQLLENPNDNPICALSYDRTIRCVTIVWRRYATSAQYRFIHEVIIQLLVQYKVSKILGDDSDLPVVHAEDQQWIVEDWAPRAKTVGLKAVATSASLSFFGRLAIGSVQGRMSRDIAVKTFPNIHAARSWLRNLPE
jgi:hypothetical protein